jgi:methylenetetrahydrofolate reductase (NADPH)
MKVDSKLAAGIEAQAFMVTAECAPGPTAASVTVEAAFKALGSRPVAVNVADNSHGVAVSSLAASVSATRLKVEPILQMVTRDRNRIALQADLLGAASLGIKNVLCLSGYHQTLMGCPESANVYDIDSTQLIELVYRMSKKGVMSDGSRIEGSFGMVVGAAANPLLRPLELNLLRLQKKVEAGARFIQTHAVFDLASFREWLEAVQGAGWADRVAILASVHPLATATEAQKLRETFAEYRIPDPVVERLRRAGDASQKEGLAICVETMQQLKAMKGLRGIHILSGGKEGVVPGLVTGAGL